MSDPEALLMQPAMSGETADVRRSLFTRVYESTALRLASGPIVLGGLGIAAAELSPASATTMAGEHAASTTAIVTAKEVDGMIMHVGPYHKNRDIHITSGSLTRNNFAEHGKCDPKNVLNPAFRFYQVTRKKFTFMDCADGDRKYTNKNTQQEGEYLFGSQLNRIGNAVVESIPKLADDPHGDTLSVKATNHVFTMKLAKPVRFVAGQKAPEEIKGKGDHRAKVIEWYTAPKATPSPTPTPTSTTTS